MPLNALRGVLRLNKLDAFFAARDMRDAIAIAAELTPPEGIAAVNYNDISCSKYSAINKALNTFERQREMSVLRLFAVDENKCFFVSEYQGNKNDGELFLYSIGTDGKNCELIKAFDEGKYISYRDFDGANSGKTPDYADIPAFYYQGKIVVNTPDNVYEFDVGSGQIEEYDAASYEYPQNEYKLSYSNGVLYAERDGEIYQVTIQELIENSVEMKYLYDLAVEQKSEAAKECFFQYILYYDAEPYIVCRPMSKYGLSFGALFKFEPDTKKVIYIDCVFTNDFPDCVYPIIVK